MFSSEKELVEKLVLDLQERYNTQYIVRELRSGKNIADVVYTTEIDRSNIVFDDYFNAYYYFNGVYSKKKISIDEVGISDTKACKKFYHFLCELEELGYVRIDGHYVTSIKKVDAVTKNFVAVEAKLSDWKAGLEQAVRYKQYANEVYVAISAEYVKNVDKDQFKKVNIGLMSVSEDKLIIPIRAKKEKVEKKDIQYYMTDRFLKQLNLAYL
ncbi:hypothetical protein WMO27_12085 [Lachnospiraceae bacterium CLA-AA-H183]|jgi:hypothetical protein